VTKFDVSNIITSQVMDCKMHVIGKAIRPLYVDPVVTFIISKVRAARFVHGVSSPKMLSMQFHR